MKNLLKRSLRSLGLSVSAVDYAQEFLPGLHLTKLFQQVGARCVVDVGANVGHYRDFLRDDMGFDGWILSMEPVPEHVEIMERKARAARDDRWQIYPLAMGDSAGVMDINVMSGGDLSSFLQPNETSPAMEIRRRASVQVATLDSFLETVETRCPLRSVFLKVDTQGFDLNVLRGAPRMLQAIPALQVEMSLLPIYEKMPSFAEVYDYLKAADFDLTGLFATSRDSTLRAREFDGVFVNNAVMRAGQLGSR
jgi:FkbM family methyltransferase